MNNKLKRKEFDPIARGVDSTDTVDGRGKNRNFVSTNAPNVVIPTLNKPELTDPTKKADTSAADEALNLLYSGANATKANDYYKKAETPFEFSLDGNALYNQYKDQYTKQAQLAREDAIGRAAAMTGGYGNSYAMSAGDSAYNARMDELNNIIPELYNMAYNQYNNERDYNLAMGDRYANKDQQEMENYLAYLETQKESTDLSNIGKDFSDIVSNLEKYKTINARAEYLASLIRTGVLTEAQGDAILARYGSVFTEEEQPLKEREYSLVNDGGADFLGLGINTNAVVSDQYGNEYSLGNLRKMLKEQYGMNDHQANQWITKNIEKPLKIKT